MLNKIYPTYGLGKASSKKGPYMLCTVKKTTKLLRSLKRLKIKKSSFKHSKDTITIYTQILPCIYFICRSSMHLKCSKRIISCYKRFVLLNFAVKNIFPNTYVRKSTISAYVCKCACVCVRASVIIQLCTYKTVARSYFCK